MDELRELRNELDSLVAEALSELAPDGLDSRSLDEFIPYVSATVREGTPEEQRILVARLLAVWIRFLAQAGTALPAAREEALERCLEEVARVRDAIARVDPLTVDIPLHLGWTKRELQRDIGDSKRPAQERAARFRAHAIELAGACLIPPVDVQRGAWAEAELPPLLKRAKERVFEFEDDELTLLSARRPGVLLLRMLRTVQRLEIADDPVGVGQQGWWLLVAGGADMVRHEYRKQEVRRGIRSSTEPEPPTAVVTVDLSGDTHLSGDTPTARAGRVSRLDLTSLDHAVAALARSDLERDPSCFAVGEVLAHLRTCVEEAAPAWVDELIANGDASVELGRFAELGALALIGAWVTARSARGGS